MSKKLTLDLITKKANAKNIDSLKLLNLGSLKISDISILSDFPLLEVLVLNKNQIKDLSIFQSLKNIRELYLSDNLINDINQIDNLKFCKKLEKIILRGNPLTNLPNYEQIIIEKLPQIKIIDDKDIKTIINEKKKNINSKSEIYGNQPAPAPGLIYSEENNENGSIEKDNQKNNNTENNNSNKNFDILNKSFKKKKTDGFYFKLKKNNGLKKNINKNIYDFNNDNSPFTTSIMEEPNPYQTLTTTSFFKNNDTDKIRKAKYIKKIVDKKDTKLSKLNYLRYQQFGGEEEKRKDGSNEKIMNQTFYMRYSTTTYNKKFTDKKENALIIDHNSKNKNKENNKKIVESIKLLISTLSAKGIEEVLKEINNLKYNLKK